MIIPAGAGQINWKFSGQNAPTGAETTLGFVIDGFSGSVTDAAELARARWATHMSPQQTAQITLSGVLVKFGPNSTGPSAEVAASTVGSVPGESDVPQSAVLVQKLTAAGGRAGRGRMYIPGFNTVITDSGGIISTSNLNGLQTAVNNLAAALSLAGLKPALLHGAGAPITGATLITSFQVQNKVATQRRRLRR